MSHAAYLDFCIRSECLIVGIGCYSKFGVSITMSVISPPQSEMMIYVTKEGNLAGSPGMFVLPDPVHSIPSEILQRLWYQYPNGFTVENIHNPIMEYRVKTNTAGAIILSIRSNVENQQRPSSLSPIGTQVCQQYFRKV